MFTVVVCVIRGIDMPAAYTLYITYNFVYNMHAYVV